MALRLRAAAATDVGNVRSSNQDDLLILDGALFAVADGMGGHASGEVASREVVDTLRSTYNDELSVDALREAIRWANRAVWRRGVDEPAHAGMGTTLTAVAVVQDDSLAVANVGDSRTYLLRDGVLTQLTSDHSFVQEAVRTGQLTREQAESHPRRSQLTRAMGIGDDVDVDIDVMVPVQGDRLLLCSDGLWDELPDDVIGSILTRLEDPAAATAELVRQAKEAGGRDNVTVVVVDVLDADAEERGLAASQDLGGAPTTAVPAVPPAVAPSLHDPGDDVWPTPAGDENLLPSSPERVGRPSSRLVTWRVVLFVIALVGVLVVAVLAFRGGQDAYRVALDGNDVVITKSGDVVERPGLTRDRLVAGDQQLVDRGVAVDSLGEARAVLTRFAQNIAQRDFTIETSTTLATTTTSASTATSAPPPTPADTAPIGP